MQNQELLTITEMAARLKVHPSWLYSRTRETGEGTIPRIKIGKYIRFNESAVMAWIKEKYGESRHEAA
jgi:excisionase family DNA binding protein